MTFLSGKVAFEKKIQQFKKLIDFEIINENIIEEYDAIKNYFSSILKTKRIEVIPTIITTDGVITSINATSAEIEKIDKTGKWLLFSTVCKYSLEFRNLLLNRSRSELC